jgi:hypothetical protein
VVGADQRAGEAHRGEAGLRVGRFVLALDVSGEHLEVGVLGEGVGADAAHVEQRAAPEGSHSAGHGGDAAPEVIDAAVDVEADDVLDVLPPRGIRLVRLAT